jgi:ubiquinone/menaquinone biosynthesis C-methylase UbiE
MGFPRGPPTMPQLDPSITDFYDQGLEAGRLLGGGDGSPDGPLELERTKELLLRHLPDGPLDVLDIGGGPGVYAEWLLDLGHRVHVVDPVELHIEQARAAGISAEVGDARALTQPDESVDVALVLGPLYHLPDRADRKRSLAETRRVLRPGGWLFAAAISRFAAMMDLLVNYDRFAEPEVQRILSECVATAEGSGGEADLGFATAYCHHPRELADEVTGAGFTSTAVYAVEGVACLPPAADVRQRWSDPQQRKALLAAARLTETDPEVIGASGHVLAVARKHA